jgi:hypothetical protein
LLRERGGEPAPGWRESGTWVPESRIDKKTNHSPEICPPRAQSDCENFLGFHDFHADFVQIGTEWALKTESA